MSKQGQKVKKIPMSGVKEIPLSEVLPSWSMMRPVQTTCVEYLELMDSIREHGIINSILVRPHPSRKGVYEVIDGMWRFSACKDLDIPEIPCIIKVGVETDDEFLALQIQANAVSFETRPIEFAEQMQRMMQLREFAGAPLTLTELAKTVSKSSPWVSNRLKLLALCDEAKAAVQDGSLGLGKAVALARIRRPKYQLEYLAKANTMKTRDFELEVGRFIAEKRHLKMGQRRQDRDEIALRPRLQTMDSMLIELDRLENLSQIIVQRGLTTALEGGKMALEWVLNLHEEGRNQQIKELRHKLNRSDRQEILGRQRYEELKQISELREQRKQRARQSFSENP